MGRHNIGPGEVVRDTVAPMVVGELDGEERERTRLLARCLEAVGDVRMTHNLRGAIWSKLLVNSPAPACPRSPACATAPSPTTPTAGSPPTRSGPRASPSASPRTCELESVLDVEPQELVDKDDAALARMMAIAGNTRPSMLQDLEQGRETEVDVVNGGVAGKGASSRSRRRSTTASSRSCTTWRRASGRRRRRS